MAATAPPPPRQHGHPRWQVALFLLGLASLLLVWRLMPTSTLRFQHLLQRARSTLASGQDVTPVYLELQEALRQSKVPQSLLGETNFWLGRLSINRVELNPGAEGPLRWLEARRYLEEALLHGVADEQTGLLRYCLAKVGYHCGESPDQVVPLLANSVVFAERKREAYQLLCEVQLLRKPANLLEALAANEQLRLLSDLTSPERAQACLQGGELLFRLHREAAGRELLASIDPAAPADVRGKARALCALSWYQERAWGKTADLLEGLLADPAAPAEHVNSHRLILGLCYRQLDQPGAAVRWWEECLRQPDELTPAAALLLAEAMLDMNQPGRCVELVARALQTITGPEEWKNQLCDWSRARTILTRIAQHLQTGTQKDLVERLQPYLSRMGVPSPEQPQVAKAPKAKEKKSPANEVIQVVREDGDPSEAGSTENKPSMPGAMPAIQTTPLTPPHRTELTSPNVLKGPEPESPVGPPVGEEDPFVSFLEHEALRGSPETDGWYPFDDVELIRVGCASCGSSSGTGYSLSSVYGTKGTLGAAPVNVNINTSCISCGMGRGPCIPGKPPCPPIEAHTFPGRILACLYECLCCPDPCYEARWQPIADSAFYQDAARPITQQRFRWDHQPDLTQMDRATFVWGRADGLGLGPQPPQPPAPVGQLYTYTKANIDDLKLYTEVAAGAFSFFTEIGYRNLNADPGFHASGFGDMNLGTKSLIFDCELLQLTFQFKTYLPTGISSKGLGTGHTSLEPSLIMGLKLAEDTYLQAQVAEWIPIGGDPGYAGSVLHGHLSTNQLLYRILPNVPLIGTLEFNDYVFQTGSYTDPYLGPGQKASGLSYLTVGTGLRVFICDKIDFGGAMAYPLQTPHWADPDLTMDFRVRY